MNEVIDSLNTVGRYDPTKDTRPQCPIADILIRPEGGLQRGRKLFTNIIDLAESLKAHGMIHPLTIVPHAELPGKFVLVAGERRLKAAILANWKTVPFHIRSDIDILESKELELRENMDREQLEWQEEIELVKQIDEIKRKRLGSKPRNAGEDDPRWNLEKTAQLVGEDSSTVGKKIKLAEKLRSRPDLKERTKKLGLTQAGKIIEQIEKREEVDRLHKQGLIQIRNEIQEGDARLLIKSVPDSSIDLILTDPPFGLNQLVEMEGKDRGGTQNYTSIMKPTDNLSPLEVLDLLGTLAPEMFRVLRPGSHFYMFISLDLYSDIQKLLLNAGFQLHSSVLIWDKEENTNAFSGTNYMASYEPFIFGWKPPQKRLNDAMKNIIRCKPVSLNARYHIFQKPADLLTKLIKNSTNIGEVVLDPFAASGETIRCAKNCGRGGLGFEIDHENWIEGQRNLMELK